MRTTDLAATSGETRVEVDVCVIGSGPVGLSVARRLAERGLSVEMLERGGAVACSPATDDEVEFGASAYGAAHAGRAYGLGGTSALWGGQLLPLSREEHAGNASRGAPPWPLEFADIQRHYPTLDAWLGVDPGAFELACIRPRPIRALEWGEFAPRLSKWLAFGRRNVAHAWSGELRRHTRLHGWLNARASAFDLDGRRLTGITCMAGEGQLKLKARHFVIAAGALESTRLALLLYREPVLRELQPASLGQYLHDHLSIRIAAVVPRRRAQLQRMFAPLFIGGTMRTLRLELSAESVESEGLDPAYAHLVADAQSESGFALARDALRALQQRRPALGLALLRRLPAAVPGLIDLATARLLQRRLALPRGAPIWLHVDLQQRPDPGNRLQLALQADASGCPRLRIDWRIEGSYADQLAVFRRHLDQLWQRNGLAQLATLEFLATEAELPARATNLYDIYHPAGTTRMAASVGEGCVDPNLRLFGPENIYIASSSVFPRLGAANPTYTAMALGVRLADQLAGLT